MITAEKFQSAQIRKWLKANIYCIATYRRLLHEQQRQKEMPDVSETEKKKLAGKIRHLDVKVDNFITTGLTLSLEKTQIIEINRQIVEGLKRERDPMAIFHQFLDGKARR
jgi:hypothetical protein